MVLGLGRGWRASCTFSLDSHIIYLSQLLGSTKIMVKRHINHEVAKLSNLIRDNDRILKRKANNLGELQDDISYLQQDSHLSANLDDMSGQLNSLLSEMKSRLSANPRITSKKTLRPQFNRPFLNNSKADSPIDNTANNQMQPDDDEFEEVESEPGEEPEELINQLNGYVKSVDLPDKEPFNEILQSTHDLVSHLPQNGKGNKQLSEFITSLESCIGAFT